MNGASPTNDSHPKHRSRGAKSSVCSRERGASWLRGFNALWRGALDLALPPSCAGCGAPVDPGAALCPDCDRRLERIAIGLCPLCQEVAATAGGGPCGACTASTSPLAACVAAVRYAGDAENWIHRFKYPRGGLRGLDPSPFSVVGALLREAAARAPEIRPDLVVPVPQHPKRLRARGFNPAALLARNLARELRIPVDPVALLRTRDTPSQTRLDRRQRRRNVRGAICVRRKRRLPERVWLIDDVVTTGSTMAEAAMALQRAEVATVVGVCAARVLSDARDPRS